MNRLSQFATAAVIATAGWWGLAAAPATAQGGYTWCPGQPLPMHGLGWDMNVCHTWYFVEHEAGNVPYQGELPSGVWDGDNPPSVRQDSCDFCS